MSKKKIVPLDGSSVAGTDNSTTFIEHSQKTKKFLIYRFFNYIFSINFTFLILS